jgi:hypothetical protein
MNTNEFISEVKDIILSNEQSDSEITWKNNIIDYQLTNVFERYFGKLNRKVSMLERRLEELERCLR